MHQHNLAAARSSKVITALYSTIPDYTVQYDAEIWHFSEDEEPALTNQAGEKSSCQQAAEEVIDTFAVMK